MKPKRQWLVIPGFVMCLALLACSTGQIPGSTPSQSYTSTLVPTITQTAKPAGPLPYTGDVIHDYYQKTGKLVQRLLTAPDATSDVISNLPPAQEWEVILLPRTPALYYVQENLFPQKTWGIPGAPAKLYLIYSYARSEDLYYSTDDAPVTQDMRLVVRGVIEIDQQASQVCDLNYLVGQEAEDNADIVRSNVDEIFQNTVFGGWWVDGTDSSSFMEPSVTGEIQSALQAILGYATGIDWNRSRSLPLRLALLDSALSSDYWSDQYQSAESLSHLGKAANDALPGLFQALILQDGTPALYKIFSVIHSIQPDSLAVEFSPDYYDTVACGMYSDQDVNSNRAIGNFPVLIAGLEDEMWERRALSAILIGQTAACNQDLVEASGQAAFQALLKTQQDDHPIARMAAVIGVGGFAYQSKEVVPVLITAASDPDYRVRRAAIRSLTSLALNTHVFEGDEQSAESILAGLSKALKDPDEEVRLEAITLIDLLVRDAKGRRELVMPALIPALMDESTSVQDAADSALKSITGQYDLEGNTPEEKAAAFQKWLDNNQP